MFGAFGLVQGSGFRVQGSGFRVPGSVGLGVEGLCWRSGIERHGPHLTMPFSWYDAASSVARLDAFRFQVEGRNALELGFEM